MINFCGFWLIQSILWLAWIRMDLWINMCSVWFQRGLIYTLIEEMICSNFDDFLNLRWNWHIFWIFFCMFLYLLQTFLAGKSWLLLSDELSRDKKNRTSFVFLVAWLDFWGYTLKITPFSFLSICVKDQAYMMSLNLVGFMVLGFIKIDCCSWLIWSFMYWNLLLISMFPPFF